MTYTTKVDWWVLVLVAGPLALGPVLILVLSPDLGQALTMLVQILPWILFACIPVALLAWPVRYRLDAEELSIRSGRLMRWRVPYKQIIQVDSPRRPRGSGPVWSMDRLQIDRVGGPPLLVSPVNKDDFLDELAARAMLTRDGSRLIRPGAFR